MAAVKQPFNALCIGQSAENTSLTLCKAYLHKSLVRNAVQWHFGTISAMPYIIMIYAYKIGHYGAGPQ